MRILITGGAGFLGSHLCAAFLSAGHEVVVLDNFSTSHPANIAEHFGNPRFHFIQQNVSHYLYVDGPLDWVLHFASPASPVDYLRLPIPTLKVGSLGTHNTLGLAKAKGAKYLLASTSEVYGDPQVTPQGESYWGHVNPVGPRGVYDEAKRFAEAMTMAYHRAHGLDTRMVRIFNTYGPKMRLDDGRAIPNFVSQALQGKELTVYGDGSQTRSFCFVEDLCRGIISLMACDYHAPVNLGNPQEFTIRELAEKVLQLTGSRSRVTHAPLPQDDPKKRRPDISLAKRLFGFSPAVGLDEGLPPTIEYFKTAMAPKR